MAEGNDQDEEVAKKSISIPNAIFVFIQVLLTDLIFYGCMIPLLATYLGGRCAYYMTLGPTSELVLIVLLTFLLLYGTFGLVGEASYWKHLFAFESFYTVLLQVRDLINTCLFIVCLIDLYSIMEAIITEDKRIKAAPVSEGALYVFLKYTCGYLHLDDGFLYTLGVRLPHKGTLFDPSFGENEKYEHGAAYMLYWAILTGCVTKVVYFSTLATYTRSMEIFLAMNPMFYEDDESESSSSATLISMTKSRKSCLENDFARFMRKHT